MKRDLSSFPDSAQRSKEPGKMKAILSTMEDMMRGQVVKKRTERMGLGNTQYGI
jgi:hypothetical protein